MLQRIDFQPAYLIHRYPYRDTSLIVDLMTRDYGRVSMVARGVRRAKSRLYPLLQPFSPLLVSWRGRHELKTLTGAELAGGLRMLPSAMIACGYYVNELLYRLIRREDPYPVIYDIYDEILSLFAEQTESTSNIDFQAQHLRVFEKRLLDELGYGLMLEHTADSGDRIKHDRLYYYYQDYGPVDVVSAIRPAGHDFVELSGKSLLALATESVIDIDDMQQTRRLMRMVLQRLLGDKPLYSRRLFRSPAKARHKQSASMARLQIDLSKKEETT